MLVKSHLHQSLKFLLSTNKTQSIESSQKLLKEVLKQLADRGKYNV